MLLFVGLNLVVRPLQRHFVNEQMTTDSKEVPRVKLPKARFNKKLPI